MHQNNIAVDSLHHNVMATNYVKPMADYLVAQYGISAKDATALAWSGLENSNAYKDATSFEYGKDTNGNPLTMTKSEIGNISSSYADNSAAASGQQKKGTAICN
jgi:hypothetical protein